MMPLQDCAFAVALLPQSITDTATAGTAIDTQPNGNKASHVTIILQAGAIGAADFGDPSAYVSECETSAGTYTVSPGITGTSIRGVLGGAILQTEDNGIWVVSVPITGARKRFLKINVDPGNAATLLSAVAILHGLANAPTTAAEAGLVNWYRIA